MIALICAGEEFKDKKFVFEYLDHYHRLNPIKSIWNGGKLIVQSLAANWAVSRSVAITRDRSGLPGVVICFPGYETGNFHKSAHKAGIPVIEVFRQTNVTCLTCLELFDGKYCRRFKQVMPENWNGPCDDYESGGEIPFFGQDII